MESFSWYRWEQSWHWLGRKVQIQEESGYRQRPKVSLFFLLGNQLGNTYIN
jgi:hypothetical protein